MESPSDEAERVEEENWEDRRRQMFRKGSECGGGTDGKSAGSDSRGEGRDRGGAGEKAGSSFGRDSSGGGYIDFRGF